jgi:hypothetical protein
MMIDEESPLRAIPAAMLVAMLLSLTPPLYPQNSWTKDLLAYWSFDEGKGTTVGDYTGGVPGTKHGNTTWLSRNEAKFGSAMRFDRSDPRSKGYVSLPPGGVLANPDTSAMTLSVWVRSELGVGDVSENYVGIFQSSPGNVYSTDPGAPSSTSDNYIIYYDKKTGYLRTKFTNAAGQNARPAVPAAEVPVGRWYHIAGVYDGTKAAIYLDGQLKEEVPFTGQLRNGQMSAIGRKGTADREYWSGDIDDLAIWRRALSPSEIAVLAGGSASLSQLIGGASPPPNLTSVAAAEKSILYYFYLPGHQPSEDFYNSVMRKSANQQTIARYRVEPVDMQTRDAEALKYRALKSPTFVIVHPDGSVVWRFSGVPAEDAFLQQLIRASR